MSGVTLQRYIEFLSVSKHPISGKEPSAYAVFKAMRSRYPRSRQVRDMAHNLSVHGVFGDRSLYKCADSCRKKGIRLTVEGRRPSGL